MAPEARFQELPKKEALFPMYINMELIVPVENIKKDILKEILLVSMKVTTNTQKENMY